MATNKQLIWVWSQGQFLKIRNAMEMSEGIDRANQFEFPQQIRCFAPEAALQIPGAE
jgi:hypothetical protein